MKDIVDDQISGGQNDSNRPNQNEDSHRIRLFHTAAHIGPVYAVPHFCTRFIPGIFDNRLHFFFQIMFIVEEKIDIHQSHAVIFRMCLMPVHHIFVRPVSF